MAPPQMKIILNRAPDQEKFFPGQSITGTLQVVLSEPKSYKHIDVTLKGKGKVKWDETRWVGEGEDRHTEIIEHSRKEEYVDKTVVVWGNKDAVLPTGINSGTYNFPFQFTLPADCPPSFKSELGEIRYKLVGELEKLGDDPKIKEKIVVGGLVDFNKKPSLAEAVDKSATEQITTCCCFNAGETEIKFKIPQSAFCLVKDVLPVTVECNNNSSKVITLRIELYQKIVYNAEPGHRKTDYKVVSNFNHEVQPSTEETKSFEFDLPSSIHLPMDTKIIDVAHVLRFWVDYSWNLGAIFEDPPISAPLVLTSAIIQKGSEAAQQSTVPVPSGDFAYPPEVQA